MTVREIPPECYLAWKGLPLTHYMCDYYRLDVHCLGMCVLHYVFF